MIFWVVILAMLLASVLCILLPLVRKYDERPESVDGTEVYREQLREIELQNPATEQEKQNLEIRRAEVARRLLKETSKRPSQSVSSESSTKHGAIAMVTIIALPLIAGVTYWSIGSPGTPDFPLSARSAEKLEDKSIEEMVQIAERHLQQNPDDARGWQVLADVYGRTRRPSDRANALQQIIRISGRTPAVLAELGEALTVADGNVITARAKLLFEEALAADPKILKASVYLAMATEQEGRFEEALASWVRLAAMRPDDKQWQDMTNARIAAMNKELGKTKSAETQSASLGDPTKEDVKAASQLSSADRMEMIEGMVAGLAAKLEDEPDNLTGWIRLIRSYLVLNKPDLAKKALQNAKSIFQAQPKKTGELIKLEQDVTSALADKTKLQSKEDMGADG